MSSEGRGLLVSCEWLKAALDEDTPDLVVVDVTWASARNCREDYDREHIPSAVFLNVMDAEHTDLFPRNIPTPDSFGRLTRAAGINQDTHVVIYSNSHTCGFFCSGRGWWSFRVFGHSKVSVLNGGLPKWKSCGYPTTDVKPAITDGNFEAGWDESFYCTFEEVRGNLTSREFELCDSRPPAAYRGTDSPGHIPGAHNIPFPSLVDSDNMEFKSVDQLKEVFSRAGVAVTKPVVGHCNGGMSSCNTVLAALLCGSPRAALYHGGFTEWRKRAPDLVEQ